MYISENCTYCGKSYTPTRRGAQKFCSNTCRSKNWQHQQRTKKVSVQNKASELSNDRQPSQHPPSTDKMSWAGIGNAAAGAVTANLISNMLTPEHNKPATKEDINKLTSLIKGERYFPVKNIKKNANGQQPYFDLMTYEIVFY